MGVIVDNVENTARPIAIGKVITFLFDTNTKSQQQYG